jgi:hypothetical protein
MEFEIDAVERFGDEVTSRMWPSRAATGLEGRKFTTGG